MKKQWISRIVGAVMLVSVVGFSEGRPVARRLGNDLSTAAKAAKAAELKQQLATSKTAWLKVKKECKGNYEYDVTFSSWVGFGSTTTIVVKDNKVVARRYKARPARNMVVAIAAPGEKPPELPKGKEWEETGDTLGSHKQGAKAKTIDQYYAEVEKLLEKGIDANHRWLVRFHKNGVIQYFGYSDKRIMDDAPFNGAKINKFTVK